MMRAARALAFALMIGTAAVAQCDTFGFMPDGGRGLFAGVFPTPEARIWALSQDLAAEGWLVELAQRAPDLPEQQAQTLAAYLALAAPVAGAGTGGGDGAASLPPDGKDLALAQCQSCHSLFSGYLMQRRDRAGWLSTFASPVHTGVRMTDQERQIFADYSAINMPMRFQDVPAELRY